MLFRSGWLVFFKIDHKAETCSADHGELLLCDLELLARRADRCAKLGCVLYFHNYRSVIYWVVLQKSIVKITDREYFQSPDNLNSLGNGRLSTFSNTVKAVSKM